MAKRSFAMNPLVYINRSSLYEPQRKNWFELFLFLPNAIGGGDPDKVDTLRKYLTLSMKGQFNLPTIDLGDTSIKYGNASVHYTGTVGLDQTGHTINCLDFIGADVERIIYDWQQLAYNLETGQMGWKANYATDGRLIEYSGDGECLSTWNIVNLFPAKVSYGNMDKENGGLKEITLTLTYDMMYKKFDSSTRHLHQQAVANSGKNMIWKESDKYEAENSGGPINPYKSDF